LCTTTILLDFSPLHRITASLHRRFTALSPLNYIALPHCRFTSSLFRCVADQPIHRFVSSTLQCFNASALHRYIVSSPHRRFAASPNLFSILSRRLFVPSLFSYVAIVSLLLSLVDCFLGIVYWDLDCRELRLSD
jgi:hypothetical protein